MQLHVGQSSLTGSLEAYATRFDLLELHAEPGKLARPARLAQMARDAPPGFVWSVVLPRDVARPEAGASAEPALAGALDAAKAIGAGWLVLRTEPALSPSARHRRFLATVVERLPRDYQLAWEPRGLWEARAAEQVAAELGVTLVRDLTREPAPDGDVVYTRLRALGRDSISLGAMERVAERLLGRRLACVIVEGTGAARAAAALRALVSELDAELEEELEEELEDELENGEAP